MKRFATALVALGLLAAPAQAQTTVSQEQEEGSSLTKPALYVPFATAVAGLAVWRLSHGPAAPELPAAAAASPTAGSGVSTTETTGTPGAADDDTPTQSVPEPGSMLLIATGLLGMAVLPRRRDRQLDE